ncbi:MAG: large conductance mechanosensitive channel protein MscL [Ignavibacteria bacterium]|nr:large conductance mechanosensitive channel protein MscL [Ignavibacteria bacterium]
MYKEFKEFISHGNAIDLAVGVIIGGAFGAIVNSIVADMLMPLLGIILGGLDFSGLTVTIGKANVLYGKFIQSVIVFLFIGFTLFLFIKAMNKTRKKEEVLPEITKDQELLAEIRDLLKSGK